jgi:sulfite exporter TauE/SafE
VIYKVLAVLIATSSGSLHCGAMCGGLSLAAGSSPRLQFLYQGTRLVSYLLFGFLSGWAGERFLDPGDFELLALLSGAVLSGWLVFSGIHLFFRGRPLEWGAGFGVPMRVFHSRRFSRASGTLRAAMIGALTPLLPCGWLMNAIFLAANSGSAWTGALIFGAVWVGSLPVLVLGQSLVRAGGGLLQARGRRAVAIIMILAGFFSVYQRIHFGSSDLLKRESMLFCQ